MKNSKPLVSVIMITYNQEYYIDEAIRGVVKQRVDFPIEVIVANDASTDGTARRCRIWAERYPDMIKFIDRSQNIGLQRNFMDAYSRCSGKYIAICEGDDWWCASCKLARQVEYMERNGDCNVCFHRVVNYFADSHTMSLSNGGQRCDMTIEQLARANMITNLSVMYRRSALSVMPEWIGEITVFDYALHMLHAENGGTIHFINRPMAVYRQNINGLWSGQRWRQLSLAMTVREHLMSHFAYRREVYDGLLEAYTAIALTLIIDCEDRGDGEERTNTIMRLLKFHDDWDEERLAQEIANRQIALSASKPTQVRKIITWVRAAISRLLPLPRIR